jgi:hypothetical protein
MDATFHGGSNDPIGDCVRHRRPEISPIISYPWQLSSSMAPLVLVTGNNLSLMSLSPAITEITDS